MSVPLLNSRHLNPLIPTSRVNVIPEDAKQPIFSDINELENHKLFFDAAEQLDLNNPSLRQIYFEKLLNIFDSFKTKPADQYHQIARSFIDRGWSQKLYMNNPSLKLEAQKPNLINKCLLTASQVSLTVSSVFSLLTGSLCILISLIGTQKGKIGPNVCMIDPDVGTICGAKLETKMQVEALFKLDTFEGATKAASVFLGIPVFSFLAFRSLSKKFDLVTVERLKDRLAAKLTNLIAESLQPNRQINVQNDRALVNLLKTRHGPLSQEQQCSPER
jgi:hypothetical protein